jgi:CubicO group peptidase (beta-lactamase class C family)
MNFPRRLVGAMGLAFVLVCFIAHAAELSNSTPAAEGLSEKKLEKVHEIMNGLVRDRHIAGGIVLIARHGKVVFHEPYGLMHLDDGRRVERDTIFRIYSMSKAITSAAALVLVDEGKLDLTAPVSRYLPEFANLKVLDGEEERPAGHAMTVTDLFCHTSGITYGSPAGNGVEKMFETLEVLDMQSDLAVMTTKLGQMPLSFDPGQDWKYGASIDVLGRVVEVASGQPLDEFLHARIFAPLGMTDTAFYVPPDKQSRFAANYYSDGKGRLIIRDEPTKSLYLRKPGLLSGGGGLVGSAADYMRFLLMVEGAGQLNSTRILSEKSVKLMTTNQLPEHAGWVTFGEDVRTGVGFGLGFSVTVEPHKANPHARHDEYGWGGAASTHYWVSPRDELIVVTMEQRMPYSPETETLLKPVIYDALLD